jgi:hypothetical protein
MSTLTNVCSLCARLWDTGDMASVIIAVSNDKTCVPAVPNDHNKRCTICPACARCCVCDQKAFRCANYWTEWVWKCRTCRNVFCNRSNHKAHCIDFSWKGQCWDCATKYLNDFWYETVRQALSALALDRDVISVCCDYTCLI